MTENTKNTQNTQNTQNAKSTQDMTVLVTGASGRTGSRVAQAARAAGLTVRAGSRATGFDWADRSTWARTLDGADAAYLMYPSDIGHPDAAESIGALAREAVAHGVRRLVLLSGRGEELALPAEEALKASGAEWTVVRAAWFAQNFSEGPLVEGLRQGQLVFPAGEVKEPFIDVRDIADVVVTAVASGGLYVGRVLEITGPRLLSWREAVAEISEAAGRDFAYVPVSSSEYRGVLTAFGIPAGEAEHLVDVFAGLLDGRNAHVDSTVRDVLGRDPRDFSDFAREAAAAGSWKA
ncbi:NmrA family transcriptional regulator [Streptomyces sp. NPDC046862]|uniref:NmrA family transcriptional regulator n=1 Tax=Streptomyces sp. NPDC046862 TaxID=3154603 RepID=UPI0034521D81